MKATKLLYRNETHGYIDVSFEEGKARRIIIPIKLTKEVVRIEDGKIKMGRYVYNTDKNTWEKISKILSFLKGIVDLIKNIFQ